MTKRELRFRAWDKINKRMIDGFWSWTPESLESRWKIGHIKEEGQEYRKLGDEYEPMQYTGLSDKNGREIYEGDVVKVKEFNDELGEVWFSPTGMWLWGDKEKEVGECFMKNETYEVVGNIYEGVLPKYENPDIMEMYATRSLRKNKKTFGYSGTGEGKNSQEAPIRGDQKEDR